MRIGSLAAALLLSVCSWQASAQEVGVADLQDFTLENGQDLADLCGAEPGDEIYAEAKQFCYGFLSGVVHFHDALANVKPVLSFAWPCVICWTRSIPTLAAGSRTVWAGAPH